MVSQWAIFETISIHISASICSGILLLTILQIYNDSKGRAFSILMANIVAISFLSMMIRVIAAVFKSHLFDDAVQIMFYITVCLYYLMGFSLTNFFSEVFNYSTRWARNAKLWLLYIHLPIAIVLVVLNKLQINFRFDSDGSILYERTTLGTIMFFLWAVPILSVVIPCLIKGFRKSEYPRSLLIGMILEVAGPLVLIIPPNIPARYILQEIAFSCGGLLILGPLLQQRLFDPLTQLNNKLFNRSNQLSTIARVGHRATSLLNLSKLLEISVIDIQSAFGYPAVTINLVDSDRERFIIGATTLQKPEIEAAQINKKSEIPIDSNSIIGAAALKRSIIYIKNAVDETAYQFNFYKKCHSVVAIPLFVGEATMSEEVLLGVLEIQSDKPLAFEDDEIEILQILSRQLAIAIRNAQLFEAKETAEAADRAKSQFLANISHELRLPLTIIQANSMILLDGLGIPPVEGQQIKAVQYIGDAGKNLLSLVETLLDLTKIEAGQVKTDFSEINVKELIQKAISNMEVLANDKNLYLKADVSDFPETIYTDGNKIHTIITNLVSNAIKFTSVGGIKIKLRIVGECWELAVSDTGIGISDEHHSRVFDNFYQVEASDKRTHTGSGIGLAIVKKLATMMNGEVHLQSKLGMGSTFRVILPLYSETTNYIPTPK